jgi:adenylate cyclase
VSQHTALIESIGDAALTVGLGIVPAAVKLLAGEMTEVLRWCDRIIDLAEGDRTLSGYFIDAPLASAYAMRSTARWWLGQAGWRGDFDCAVAMARDADPLSQAMVVAYTYTNAITCGVIAADDAVMRDIDEGLQTAERSADDLAVGLALYCKANALRKHNAAEQERTLDLLAQLRERSVDGRFYPWLVPVVDVCVAEVRMTREDGRAVPPPRASVDELFANGSLTYAIWGTNVLVEILLNSGTASDVQEAEAAIDRISAERVLEGSAFRDLILLRMRALLARARGDETGLRDLASRYRDLAISLGFVEHIAIAEEMVGANGEPRTAS